MLHDHSLSLKLEFITKLYVSGKESHIALKVSFEPSAVGWILVKVPFFEIPFVNVNDGVALRQVGVVLPVGAPCRLEVNVAHMTGKVRVQVMS